MAVRHKVNTVLVHYDPFGGPDRSGVNDSPSSQSRLDHWNRLAWYCEWAAETARSVIVLLPRSLRPGPERSFAHLESVSVVWYEDDCEAPLPQRPRGQMWLINGNQMPIVEWDAVAAARRRDCDVLMFGQRQPAGSVHYPESVVIDGTGRVIKFRRHYFDSPVFADRWSGQASFLVASGRQAQAVLTQILARGWKLDSVGALTRRFSVRWSSDPCILAEADPSGRNVRRLEDAVLSGGTPNAAWREGTPEDGDQTDGPSAASQRSARVVALDDLSRFTGSTFGGAVDWFREGGFTATPGLDVGEGADVRIAPERAGSDGNPPPSTLDDDASVQNDRLYLIVKRLMDVIVAATGLIVLSPFLLVVAAMIKLTSPGRVLFGHKRQGLEGKEFRCWKFRSMESGADALQSELRKLNEVDGPQFKITADPRITRIGNWLRHSNVDEIPQLINVLIGQMSLVGPRPSPDAENQLCPAWRRARLSVKPGITGLWQILRLRDMADSDFQEWIYYDIEYTKHRSGWLDLQIVLHTPIAMYASHRMTGFAARLERHGICPHSGQIASRREPASELEVPAGMESNAT